MKNEKFQAIISKNDQQVSETNQSNETQGQ